MKQQKSLCKNQAFVFSASLFAVVGALSLLTGSSYWNSLVCWCLLARCVQMYHICRGFAVSVDTRIYERFQTEFSTLFWYTNIESLIETTERVKKIGRLPHSFNHSQSMCDRHVLHWLLYLGERPIVYFYVTWSPRTALFIDVLSA